MKVSYLPSGRQMERWLEAIRDIVSREASSVEDPEGVGDDPGVGHKPVVDSEVEDELLLEVALPEGDGTRGEGHLGGGQAHVEGQPVLLRGVRHLAGTMANR